MATNGLTPKFQLPNYYVSPNTRKENKMNYEKECQEVIDEIKNQFNDDQNSFIQHFEHGFINENFGKHHNDPDYNDGADEKCWKEVLYDAQTDLLNDKEAFEEFVWYDERIRPLIMKLARKICEESHNA